MKLIKSKVANDPLSNIIYDTVNDTILKHPIEYKRYKDIITDEYFCILMECTSIPYNKKIELLENHLNKWGPDTVTNIKPLNWD